MASELIEKDIYNGLFHIVHNPNARGRAPRYKVNDDKPVGVTTLLSKTLSKDLMSWAVNCAIDYLRGKLPVVTEKDLKEAANAYNVKRDFGSSTGTEAHALVELYLKGKSEELELALQNPSKEAQNAYLAFLEWYEDVMPTVINVEEVVYSDEYKYCGTYDCMLKIDGKNWLCDFKTTNISKAAPKGVYAENFLQLGAYANAHEEQRQHELANGGSKLKKIDGLMVISGKKNGQLDIVTNNDVDLTVLECMERFTQVVEVYRFMQSTTKKLGG